MKKTGLIIFSLAIFLAIVATFILYGRQPGKLDEFAECLKERKTVFYGAFWCSHCQNQKAMFGKSAKLLPYTECSAPNGEDQLAVCKEKGITQYPTWEFADGTRETGEVSLIALSEKTGCVLPQ